MKARKKRLDAKTSFRDRSVDGMLAWLYIQFICDDGTFSSQRAMNMGARQRIECLMNIYKRKPDRIPDAEALLVIRRAIIRHTNASPQSPHNTKLKRFAKKLGFIDGIADMQELDKIAEELFSDEYGDDLKKISVKKETPVNKCTYGISFEIPLTVRTIVEIDGGTAPDDIRTALREFGGTADKILVQIENGLYELKTEGLVKYFTLPHVDNVRIKSIEEIG